MVNAIGDMCMVEDGRGSGMDGLETTRKLAPIGVYWAVCVGHHISYSG